MASAQPTQDAILQFQGIAPVDYDTANKFLAGARNDVERALSDYFDNSDKYKNSNTYDEGQWDAGREYGPANNNNIPAFQIQGPDDAGYPQSGAPTRPPSRVSQSSSTRGAVSGSPRADPYNGNEMMQSQELGVVGGTGAQFGPAKEGYYYDNSSWAMTLANPSAVEVIPDPGALQRKREDGEPCFLKPLVNGDYLPSLITILHSIPIARDVLTFPNNLLGNYGGDDDWWRGAPIRLYSVVDAENDEPMDHGQEVIREVQRLMAFLEDSERSDGSVEPLSRMKALDEESQAQSARTLCDRFLVGWEAVAKTLDPNLFANGSLFKSTASEFISPDESQDEPFWCLNLSLENGKGPMMSLYDLLDFAIWGNDPDGTKAEEQSITEISPVLVMRISQPDGSAKGLNMEVPTTWFVDRYLHENSISTKIMRRNRAKCSLEIQRLEGKQEKLKTFVHPKTGKTFAVEQMLAVAKSAFEPPPKTNMDEDDRDDDESEPELPDYAIPELPPIPDIVAQLQAIADNVKRKVERLEEEKEKAAAELERCSALFKEPSEYESQNPKVKYSLCGLATDSRTTFVLRRAKETLVDVGMEEGEPEKDQWWRLHYSNDPEITKSTVEEVDVVKAGEESRDVLLVYGSNEAIAGRGDFVLPEPLKTFVDQDNASFRQEQRDATAAADAATSALDAEITPLTGWTDDPPAYQEEGFVPDDRNIKDDAAYAKSQSQSMIQRARAIKEKNNPIPAIPASVLREMEEFEEREREGLGEDVHDTPMMDVDLGGDGDGEERQRVEHVEFATK